METAARTTIGLQIGTVQGSLSAGVFVAWVDILLQFTIPNDADCIIA
jgi:hypothetical protein